MKDDLGQGLGLGHLQVSGLVSTWGLVVGVRWVVPPVLTSGPRCLVGDGWEACTGEKGLSGLVRLTELMGLAGLVVLKEQDTPLAAVREKRRRRNDALQ